MNNKKLDVYLRKEFRKMGKDLKREKARCARLYPDWRDDEFNMLDNLFIWGYNVNPDITPSFLSWDDAYIYYNRANKKYYMTIDVGFYRVEYDSQVAWEEYDRLIRIKEAFRNFLVENDELMEVNIFPFTGFALESYTLHGLYTNFCAMLEGYKSYNDMINNKPQN